MKNVLAVMTRFYSVSLAFGLMYVFLLILAAAMGMDADARLDAIIAGALCSVLLAVTAGSFSAFFTLNRLYSSRITGYLTIFLLACIPLTLSALGLRLLPDLQHRTTYLDPGFFPGFHILTAWFAEIASESWITLALALGSFAAFLASFWGLTRLSAKRPLTGALLMPACLVFAIYAYSVFLSGPVDALISFLNLSLSKPMAAAALAILASLALFLVDLIMARPPAGRRHHG